VDTGAVSRRRSARRAPLRREHDARLVELAREGDEHAFEALVARHRPALRAHCRNVVGDGAADDAVQQAFVSAWTSLRRRIEVVHVRAWLFTIAHRAALQVLRDRRAQPVELPRTVAGGSSTLEQLVQAERARAALRAVANLPDREREALISSSLDGYSGRELARTLGVTEGAARQLVFRARARARAAIPALVPPALLSRLRSLLGSGARHAVAFAQRSLEAPSAWPAPARLASLAGGAAAAAVLAGGSSIALHLGSPHHAAPRSVVRGESRRATHSGTQRSAAHRHAGRARAGGAAAPQSPSRSATASDLGTADGASVKALPQAPTARAGDPRSGIAATTHAGVPTTAPASPHLTPPVAASVPPDVGAATGAVVGGVLESVEAVTKSTERVSEPLLETARRLTGN
jgi:RNA polymerase sigma-70 factor, ECF subfamily